MENCKENNMKTMIYALIILAWLPAGYADAGGSDCYHDACVNLEICKK